VGRWGGKGRARLERVGRDVDPAAVADLLERPPRATVAFVHGDEVEALPALARWRGGVHGFAVRAEDAPDLDGREVVLVRDDGPYWFELRGVTVRGLARRAEAQDGDRSAWYDVEPRRVLAWDYGALRVVPGD
jgi:hypothetical protein